MSEFGQPNQLGESGGNQVVLTLTVRTCVQCALSLHEKSARIRKNNVTFCNIIIPPLPAPLYFPLTFSFSFFHSFFFFPSPAYYLTCLQAAVEFIVELQQLDTTVTSSKSVMSSTVISSAAAHTHVAIPNENLQQNVDSADAFLGLDSMTQIQDLTPAPTPVPVSYNTYSCGVHLNAEVQGGDKSVAHESVADGSVADESVADESVAEECRSGVVDTDCDSYGEDSRNDKTQRRDDGYAAVLKLGERSLHSAEMHTYHIVYHLITQCHAMQSILVITCSQFSSSFLQVSG